MFVQSYNNKYKRSEKWLGNNNNVLFRLNSPKHTRPDNTQIPRRNEYARKWNLSIFRQTKQVPL